MRSVTVVLPASMWAMMPKLRILPSLGLGGIGRQSSTSSGSAMTSPPSARFFAVRGVVPGAGGGGRDGVGRFPLLLLARTGRQEGGDEDEAQPAHRDDPLPPDGVGNVAKACGSVNARGVVHDRMLGCDGWRWG